MKLRVLGRSEGWWGAPTGQWQHCTGLLRRWRGHGELLHEALLVLELLLLLQEKILLLLQEEQLLLLRLGLLHVLQL